MCVACEAASHRLRAAESLLDACREQYAFPATIKAKFPLEGIPDDMRRLLDRLAEKETRQ